MYWVAGFNIQCGKVAFVQIFCLQCSCEVHGLCTHVLAAVVTAISASLTWRPITCVRFTTDQTSNLEASMSNRRLHMAWQRWGSSRGALNFMEIVRSKGKIEPIWAYTECFSYRLIMLIATKNTVIQSPTKYQMIIPCGRTALPPFVSYGHF